MAAAGTDVANGTNGDAATTTKKGVRASLASSMAGRIDALGAGEAKEFFWGCELSKEKTEVTWDFGAAEEEDEVETDFLVHTLFLRQAVLGSTAGKEDRHVIQVETKNFDGKDVKQPIVVLRAGQTESCNLDLTFTHDIPVTFKLIEGSGPVYLSANHAVEWPHEQEAEYMTEDTMTEGEEEIEKPGKRKASRSLQSKRKKARRAKDVEESEEDTEEDEVEEAEETEENEESMEEDEEESEEEEEEEEEESEEEEPPPKKKGRPKAKAKVEKVKKTKASTKAKSKGKGKKK